MCEGELKDGRGTANSPSCYSQNEIQLCEPCDRGSSWVGVIVNVLQESKKKGETWVGRRRWRWRRCGCGDIVTGCGLASLAPDLKGSRCIELKRAHEGQPAIVSVGRPILGGRSEGNRRITNHRLGKERKEERGQPNPPSGGSGGGRETAPRRWIMPRRRPWPPSRRSTPAPAAARSTGERPS